MSFLGHPRHSYAVVVPSMNFHSGQATIRRATRDIYEAECSRDGGLQYLNLSLPIHARIFDRSGDPYLACVE